MRVLLTFLLAVITTQVFGNGQVTTRQKYDFNHYLGPAAFTNTLGTVLDRKLNLLRAQYDFSVDGGSQILVTPSSTVVLPDNAIITQSWVEVITAFLPATTASVISVRTEAALDVLASTAASTLSAGTIIAGASTGTAANFKKMSAERTLKVDIASASITAGKMDIYIQYVRGN